MRLITFVALQRVIVERRVGIPILETVRGDVIPAVAGGIPLLVVTMVGLRLCLDAGIPVFAAMALPGVVGLAVYAAILRRFFPATWMDVRMLTSRLALPIAPRAVVGRVVASLGGKRAEERGGADQAAAEQRPPKRRP